MPCCSPKVADEDDETLTLLPLEHLIVGQHYTPLGLRLTRQLFLIFDQDGDDRLSADELHLLNIVRRPPCSLLYRILCTDRVTISALTECSFFCRQRVSQARSLTRR